MISLLAIDEIEEGTSKGIEINGAFLFAVKKDDQLFLYYNRCPHLGTPLPHSPLPRPISHQCLWLVIIIIT